MDPNFDPLSKAHACIVTKNIERLRQNWKKFLGIDLTPNFTLEGPAIVRGEDRGQCKALIAFADIGEMRVEFIQPVEGGTQEWEFLKQTSSGLHHIDPILPRHTSLEEHVKQWEERGIKCLQIDKKNGWAYMDTQELLGAVIELH